MNTPLRTWLGLALVVAVAGLTTAIARRDSRPAAQPHDLKGLIPWRSNLNSATKEAQAAHKLLLVEFAAGWCPDCQAMAAQTWSQPSVATALATYVPVMIDPDASPDLAQRFNVVSIPTLLLIDPSSGKVLRDSRDRDLSPDELLAWLKVGNQKSAITRPVNSKDYSATTGITGGMRKAPKRGLWAYLNSNSPWSRSRCNFSWSRMYCRICSSFNPTVLTQ